MSCSFWQCSEALGYILAHFKQINIGIVTSALIIYESSLPFPVPTLLSPQLSVYQAGVNQLQRIFSIDYN